MIEAGARPVRSRDWRATVLIAVFSALFIALGVNFARVQNIWVDETTQLLGSRLPVGTMLRWLTGSGLELGVPPDRAPPIGYLIDAGCWAAGCRGEFAFRMLHLAIATVGVVVFLRLATSRLGLAAAVVSGVLVALWPIPTAFSVEIRAYPIFFAVACVVLALFWRVMEAERLTWRVLLPFWAAALFGIYTHFFGLVMAGSYCAGLLFARARTPREAGMVVATGVSLLVLGAGIVPFVTAATSFSAATEHAVGPGQFPVALLRMFAGPEAMLYAPLAALYFVALGALIAIALWRILAAPGPIAARLSTPLAGVAATVAVGLTISFTAALVLTGFNPLGRHYNFWMWPAFALLAGSACAPGLGRTARGMAAAAGAALTVAVVGVASVFAAHATWFVHGPERFLVAAVADPRRTAMVYDGPAWGFGYFPMLYRFGTDFPQYVRTESGEVRRIRPGGKLAPARPASELSVFPEVIVAAIDLETYSDLRQRRAGNGLTYPDIAPPAAGFELRAQGEAPGIYNARVARYEATAR